MQCIDFSLEQRIFINIFHCWNDFEQVFEATPNFLRWKFQRERDENEYNAPILV